MIEELAAWAKVSELRQGVARYARLADVRRAGPVPAQGAPSAGQRLQRILADLYGPGHAPDSDPALFQRLAWSGATGD